MTNHKLEVLRESKPNSSQHTLEGKLGIIDTAGEMSKRNREYEMGGTQRSKYIRSVQVVPILEVGNGLKQ